MRRSGEYYRACSEKAEKLEHRLCANNYLCFVCVLVLAYFFHNSLSQLQNLFFRNYKYKSKYLVWIVVVVAVAFCILQQKHRIPFHKFAFNLFYAHKTNQHNFESNIFIVLNIPICIVYRELFNSNKE